MAVEGSSQTASQSLEALQRLFKIGLDPKCCLVIRDGASSIAELLIFVSTILPCCLVLRSKSDGLGVVGNRLVRSAKIRVGDSSIEKQRRDTGFECDSALKIRKGILRVLRHQEQGAPV